MKTLLKNVKSNIILFFIVLLTACTTPIEVREVQQEKVQLNLPNPNPISTLDLKWIVITKDNADNVFDNLESSNIDQVLIGLTDEEYQNLSLNMAEIKKYLLQQKFIIESYKEYYENQGSSNEEEKKKE